MNTAHQDAIRTRAHQLWEQEGRPEGREADHWRAAEEELGQHFDDGSENQNGLADDGSEQGGSATESPDLATRPARLVK